MRISDWSSDVCSSDLRSCRPRRRPGRHATGESAGARAAGRSRGLRVRLLPLPGDQLFQPDLATVLMLDLGLPVVALAVVEPVLRRAHRSVEHTSEIQPLMRISFAVFCLKTIKIPPI